MAVVAIILALSLPAINGLSSSNNLNNGGRTVSNLLAAARSEAINRRSLVRFEIATTWSSNAGDAYRKVVLVQHDSTAGTDTPITNWQTLPTGVVFQDPSTLTGVKQQTPPIKFANQDVTSYYVEFLPTGALNIPPSASPVTFRVMPGFVSGSSRPTATSTTNWFNISIDALVGRVAITHP